MTASSTTTAKTTSRKRNRSLPRDVLTAFHQAVETTMMQHSFEAPSDRCRVDESGLQNALRASITACLTSCAYLIWTHRFARSKAITARKFFDDVHWVGCFPELDIDRICDWLLAAGISQMQTADLARLYQHILSFRVVKHGTAPGAWRLQLDEKAKKDLGNFYTPMELSRLAAKQALEPLVRSADGHLNSPGEILNLRVVDPAMGGGAFLSAALDYLTEVLQESVTVSKQQSTYPDLRRLVLTNCLHGVDLDPVAVEVCLLTLLLESRCSENLAEISSSLRRQLKCGNSLIGCWRSQASTKLELDLFCAAWFRQGNGKVPSSSSQSVDQVTDEDFEETQRLSRQLRFFHWELEFPQVFDRQNPGFDAVVGNPPWEIHKPNSREFFQRLDPAYWNYGKQDALSRQEELCRTDPIVHRMWCEYRNEYLAFRRWVRYSASCSADANGSSRPFQHQGSADLNAYKLFLEASHHLLRNNGVLSFIVPSGIYADLGARALRRLFLDQSRWLSIVGFENRGGLFDIHRSFKFCLISVQKGGETEAIAAQFMLSDPAQVSDALAECVRSVGLKSQTAPTSDSAVTLYQRSLVSTFSPSASSVFEFEHHRDLQILERIYAVSTRLNDGFAQVEFEREFDMTNDSRLFVPLQSIQAQGYVADEYGHWLAGQWRPASTSCSRSLDTIVSSDRSQQIEIGDVVQVALPLYEGRMVGQFDFSQKGWVSGKSRRAVWAEVHSDGKAIRPQYLVLAENYLGWTESLPIKCGFLAVGSATNSRSMIASAIDNFPCGNAVGTLKVPTSQQALLLLACLNSYVFDFALRCRLAGNNLNYFVIAECPLPRIDLGMSLSRLMAQAVARLNLNHPMFAQRWLDLFSSGVSHSDTSRIHSENTVHSSGNVLDRLWLCDPCQRRELRAVVDAALAHLYGLTFEDLKWILRGCAEVASGNRSAKGFWRCEKDLPLSQRQSALTLAAFEDIARTGLDQAFGSDTIESLDIPVRAALEQHAERKGRLINHWSARNR